MQAGVESVVNSRLRVGQGMTGVLGDDLCLPGLLISSSMIESCAPESAFGAVATATVKMTNGPRKRPEVAAPPPLPASSLLYFCFLIASSASVIFAHASANSSKLKGIVLQRWR
jgi:hypothetical protein